MHLRDKVQPDKTAHLIIDKQNGFFDSKGELNKRLGLDTSPMREVAPRLDAFIAASRDAGLRICFSQMINDEHSPKNLIERLTQGAESGAGEWPYALQPGSWDGDFYGEKPQPSDLVLEKRTFDFFTNPKLLEYLHSHGIENTIITGAYANVCVPTTAVRAFSEGFNVVVPRDLVTTTRQKLAAADLILTEGGYTYYELAASQDILDAWQS